MPRPAASARLRKKNGMAHGDVAQDGWSEEVLERTWRLVTRVQGMTDALKAQHARSERALRGPDAPPDPYALPPAAPRLSAHGGAAEGR